MRRTDGLRWQIGMFRSGHNPGGIDCHFDHIVKTRQNRILAASERHSERRRFRQVAAIPWAGAEGTQTS